jgi:hypothetical protein
LAVVPIAVIRSCNLVYQAFEVLRSVEILPMPFGAEIRDELLNERTKKAKQKNVAQVKDLGSSTCATLKCRMLALPKITSSSS